MLSGTENSDLKRKLFPVNTRLKPTVTGVEMVEFVSMWLIKI